jgi:small subunit ribosomal protein S17
MANKTNDFILATIINVIDSSTSRVSIKDEVYNSKYSKYYKRTRKLLVDNDGKLPKAADIVKIRSTKPISKNKSWIIIDVINSKTSVDIMNNDVEEIK